MAVPLEVFQRIMGELGAEPDRGEQRAFAEFLERNTRFSVTEFRNFGWHGKSFIVHTGDDTQPAR